MERRFVKSGIPGLDEILGGGFLENSIVTVGGPSGSGKSTFALQFLYNGAYESDEVGVYICIEENRQDFMFHMGGYVWDMQKAESERKIVFLDYPVHEVDQILGQSTAIAELINSVGAKRVVIDSVMPIALQFHNEDERKKGFLKFIENIRKWETTTLIVSEDTTPEANWEMPTSIYGIEKFTDGWIDISYRFDEKKGQRQRYVEVLKMKGVFHSMKPHPARITTDGFSLEEQGKQSVTKEAPVRKIISQPKPAIMDEITPYEEEPKPMRRIMMPPGPAPKAPPSGGIKIISKPPTATKIALSAPSAKSAPAKSPVKPVPKASVQKSRIDKDINAARLSLAAKLAEAKSKIIKKSK